MQLFKQHQKCIKTVDFKVDHKYTIRLNYTRSKRIGEGGRPLTRKTVR